MQRELFMFVALILGNLHGNNGIPTTVRHSRDNKHDRSSSDDDLMAETDECNGDSATRATARRSTAISAPHLPYNQNIHMTGTRRDGSSSLTAEEEAAAASEGFYPSFMRSSRQYFHPSESERFRQAITGRAKFADQSLLGSGDFGVLKGGTFYQDNDPPVKVYNNDFYGLSLKSHNGHQRPYAAPLVQKFRYPSDPSDPFSNFRDFADINVSNDAGQYSEFYVVYANKNSSQAAQDILKKENGGSKKPIRNIKDQLDLIDKETNLENKLTKFSKVKLKLAKFKKQTEKKYNTQISVHATSTTLSPDSERDFMLALS